MSKAFFIIILIVLITGFILMYKKMGEYRKALIDIDTRLKASGERGVIGTASIPVKTEPILMTEPAIQKDPIPLTVSDIVSQITSFNMSIPYPDEAQKAQLQNLYNKLKEYGYIYSKGTAVKV